MAIEDWVDEAKKKPRTPKSKKTLKKISNDKASPIEIVEALAERLDDRLAYHEQRLRRGEKVTIHLVGLRELRQMLFLLVAQVRHWQQEVWPKAGASILADAALGEFTNYRVLYEESEKKYQDLIRFMVKTKSMLTEDQVEALLDRLERKNKKII